MPRPKRITQPSKKDMMMGRIFKVQELIDFFVLSEIFNGPQYIGYLDEQLTVKLGNGNMGVSQSYLCERVSALAEKGFIKRSWNDEERYNRLCFITDAGQDYLRNHVREIPGKIAAAEKLYKNLKQYMKRFDNWDLS